MYQFLLRGARNHLRTLSSLLPRSGGNYQPNTLSQEAFQTIIKSPHEIGPAFSHSFEYRREENKPYHRQLPGRGMGNQ